MSAVFIGTFKGNSTFHFSGIFKGRQILQIKITNSLGAKLFEYDRDYILNLKIEKIARRTVYATVIKSKLLS